jgi:hypothetical protein
MAVWGYFTYRLRQLRSSGICFGDLSHPVGPVVSRASSQFDGSGANDSSIAGFSDSSVIDEQGTGFPMDATLPTDPEAARDYTRLSGGEATPDQTEANAPNAATTGTPSDAASVSDHHLYAITEADEENSRNLGNLQEMAYGGLLSEKTRDAEPDSPLTVVFAPASPTQPTTSPRTVRRMRSCLSLRDAGNDTAAEPAVPPTRPRTATPGIVVVTDSSDDTQSFATAHTYLSSEETLQAAAATGAGAAAATPSGSVDCSLGNEESSSGLESDSFRIMTAEARTMGRAREVTLDGGRSREGEDVDGV